MLEEMSDYYLVVKGLLLSVIAKYNCFSAVSCP